MRLSKMTVDDIQKVASMIFAAKDKMGYPMLTQLESEAAVAGVLLIGASLDLTVYEALNSMWVRDGNVNLNANLMASKIKSHPDYDYRVIENTDTICRIEFLDAKTGAPIGSSTYTIEDAERAGLTMVYSTKAGKKIPQPAWTKYRRQMLFARCLSEGYNTHCPNALTGRVFVEAHGQLEVEGSMERDVPPPTAAPPQRAVSTPVEPEAHDAPLPSDDTLATDPPAAKEVPEKDVAETPKPKAADRKELSDHLLRLVRGWSGCAPEDSVSLTRKVLSYAAGYDQSGTKKATIGMLAKAIAWVNEKRTSGVSVADAFARPNATKGQQEGHDDDALADAL